MRVREHLMTLVRRVSALAQARCLRWLLVVALVMLYSGWIEYVVSRNEIAERESQ